MASCVPPFVKPSLLKPFKSTKTVFTLAFGKPVHEQHLPLVNPKPIYPSNRCNSTPSLVPDLSLNRKKNPDVFSNSFLKEEDKGQLVPLAVLEAVSDDALIAASNLRVRTFYDFKQSYGVEAHKKYRSQLEFQALKARIAGELVGFEKVTCVIATIPFSESLNLTDDLCSLCKAIINGEEQIVVGTLDLIQSSQLPDEISGTRPQVLLSIYFSCQELLSFLLYRMARLGDGATFFVPRCYIQLDKWFHHASVGFIWIYARIGTDGQFTRAYLTNVCVAQELHRKGIGSALIRQAVKISEQWGMTDLYVHVAVDNAGARCLYEKSGFVYESDEPAWRARFLGRPPRLLLWANMDKLLSYP